MPLTSSIHARAAGRAVLVAALLAGLGGCGAFNDATRGMADTLTLYKPEVVQGNFVSKEQVEDYARRKGVSLQQAERWLAANLDYDPE